MFPVMGLVNQQTWLVEFELLIRRDEMNGDEEIGQKN